VRSVALVLPGFLFGVGLAISGLTDPAKVLAFLDVAGGAWDPSLLVTMAGALGSFALLNLLVHRRAAPLLGGRLPGRRGTGAVRPRVLVGAAVFGLGWGIGGVCPGPALADLALLRLDVVAFVAAMAAGMILAQRGLGVDAPPAAPEAGSAPSGAGS